METIIENNLIHFYLSFADHHGTVVANKNTAYSYVKTSAYPWPNYVFGLDLKGDASVDVIHSLNERINHGEIPPFIISKNTDKNPNLVAAFNKFGMRQVMKWTGMAALKEQIARSVISSDKYIIKTVQNHKELKDWANTANQALFQQKKLNVHVFRKLLNNENYHFVLSFANEGPVGTALVYDDGASSGIYLVSVVEKHRKQGLGSAMTQFIIGKNPRYPVVLHATRAGKKVYDKFNFKEYCTFEIYWKTGKF